MKSGRIRPKFERLEMGRPEARLNVIFLLFAMALFPSLAKAEYYVFSENHRARPSWVTPVELLRVEPNSSLPSLLSWLSVQGHQPQPNEPYNRKFHFGDWIEEKSDPDCYDIRTEALMRDSQTAVTFSRTNPCKVATGQWWDPYSGKMFYQSSDIEIDHAVALKNAYTSGAWKWSEKARCAYANFLGYDKHLISVSMRENRSKSDDGPDQWMPSNPQYACQHLHNWLTVKLIWNLSMTDTEVYAIGNLFKKFACDPQVFNVSRSEIYEVRQRAQETLRNCF